MLLQYSRKIKQKLANRRGILQLFIPGICPTKSTIVNPLASPQLQLYPKNHKNSNNNKHQKWDTIIHINLIHQDNAMLRIYIYIQKWCVTRFSDRCNPIPASVIGSCFRCNQGVVVRPFTPTLTNLFCYNIHKIKTFRKLKTSNFTEVQDE